MGHIEKKSNAARPSSDPKSAEKVQPLNKTVPLIGANVDASTSLKERVDEVLWRYGATS